jgi:hypothetical protein
MATCSAYWAIAGHSNEGNVGVNPFISVPTLLKWFYLMATHPAENEASSGSLGTVMPMRRFYFQAHTDDT